MISAGHLIYKAADTLIKLWSQYTSAQLPTEPQHGAWTGARAANPLPCHAFYTGPSRGRTRMPAIALLAFLYCAGARPRLSSRTSRRPAARARYVVAGCPPPQRSCVSALRIIRHHRCMS